MNHAIVMMLLIPQYPTLTTHVDNALILGNLNTETARFDSNILRFFSFDEFTLPSFEALSEKPFRIPFYIESLRRSCTANYSKPNELLMSTRAWTGDATRRTLLGDPIADAKIKARSGGLDQALQRLGLTPTIPKDLPKEVMEAAALIIQVAIDKKPLRDLALSSIDVDERFAALNVKTPNPTEVTPFRNLLNKVDLKLLYAAGHDLVLATQTAANLIADIDPKLSYEFSIDTAWGKIILRGAGSNITIEQDYFLIMDTGGSDIYLGGANNRSAQNWISVLIDSNGNDRYVRKENDSPNIENDPTRKEAQLTPHHAGAAYGFAFLFDLSGDDFYRSDRPSQGSAEFGMAVLYDRSGNDTYDSYRNAQGYARAGFGLLCDEAGNDKYATFLQGQGCGLTRGVGMLIDASGDDTFLANDHKIDFPSAQSQDHNISMSQGAGFGVRADYSDGHSLGGGLGLLWDGAGNDRYTCGVFGQGVGYWQGIGILLDDNGNDVYSGVWYVQGASAHFAIGYLEDRSGDDQYQATMNMAQGAGHDFSIGVLLDHTGDDVYQAPNLSLGASNANGIGWFTDVSGNDKYHSNGTTLGMANPVEENSIRWIALGLGLFMDLNGNDTYPQEIKWANDHARTVNWQQRLERPSESRLGIFYDLP